MFPASDLSAPPTAYRGRPTFKLSTLHQSTYWVDVAGARHEISSMSRSYCLNLMRFLDRRAFSLHNRYCYLCASDPGPNGDMANLAWEQGVDELFDMDPLMWLHTTKLYRRLRRRTRPIITNRRTRGYCP